MALERQNKSGTFSPDSECSLFSKSAINILNITEFANHLNSDDGTGITFFARIGVLEPKFKGIILKRLIIQPPISQKHQSMTVSCCICSGPNLSAGMLIQSSIAITIPTFLIIRAKSSVHLQSRPLHLQRIIPNQCSVLANTLLYSKEGHTTYVNVKQTLLGSDNHLHICFVISE